jgi:hypothetical protein
VVCCLLVPITAGSLSWEDSLPQNPFSQFHSNGYGCPMGKDGYLWSRLGAVAVSLPACQLAPGEVKSATKGFNRQASVTIGRLLRSLPKLSHREGPWPNRRSSLFRRRGVPPSLTFSGMARHTNGQRMTVATVTPPQMAMQPLTLLGCQVRHHGHKHACCPSDAPALACGLLTWSCRELPFPTRDPSPICMWKRAAPPDFSARC